MESQEFAVLYTHQKMKKSKVWQDGILKVTHLGNKAILYDDKGACLESLFLKCLEVKPGDDIESDRYLITVEEVKVAASIAVGQAVTTGVPESNPRKLLSSGRSLGCQPSGLKRKYTGFQGPRQVPKRMVVAENDEPAASLEAGPASLFPFFSTPSLFSTVGKRETNNVTAHSEDTIPYKENATSYSSVTSTSSSKINSDESYFCVPLSSESQHSGSLLTSEPTKGHTLASHCPEVSQNIRSKAQIIALLKSKSTKAHTDLNSETTGLFPQVQSQANLTMPTTSKGIVQLEECAGTESTENVHYQHQPENASRNRSRWAVYLSSQSSPVCCSNIGRNDTEEKAVVGKNDVNLNLEVLLAQKRMQALETCAEKGQKHKDESIDDQSWNQEEKLEIPSFYESNRCSNVESDGLVAESDTQKNNKIPSSLNDKVCIEGSVCVRANAQMVNTCGTPKWCSKHPVLPLPEPEHPQIDSSLSNNSRVSDDVTDMISSNNTNSRNLSSSHEPVSNVTHPFMAVTFNLSNFQTSDSEEESQESSPVSRDSEIQERKSLVNDDNSSVQERCKDISYQISKDHLPLLKSVGDRNTENCPIEETLSQFCDKTCVGFDIGPCKEVNPGEALEEEDSDTLSNFDSSLEWSNDVHVDNKRGANKSIQKVRINDFASISNKAKGTNADLHVSHFSDILTCQIPENDDFLPEGAQPASFSAESDRDAGDEAVLPWISGSNNSTQPLNNEEDHPEDFALDKSNTPISNLLPDPLGETHLINKDTKAHTPESEDLGRIRRLSHDHMETEVAREKQSWDNSRNFSELSEVVNNISLLKSLSEYSTALESLERLKKKSIFFQQGTQQTYEPDNSPEARKSNTTVVSQAMQKSHLKHDSQQPVEFLGHQVKGSATSGVMVRGHSTQLGCSPFPDSVDCENFLADTCVLTPALSGTCMQTGFLQVTSPEQRLSSQGPVSTFSLNSSNEDFVVEFSEKSLRARTLPGMKNFSPLENKNFQRPSLVSRARVPLVTLPLAGGPPSLDACSFVIDSDVPESSGSPVFGLFKETAFPSCSFGPRGQSETCFSEESGEMTLGDVSLLNHKPTQSKWLKYQNISQGNLTDRKVTDGFCAEAVYGMQFSDTGDWQNGAMNKSSLDSVSLQMMKDMLYEQKEVSGQELVSRKQELCLNLKQNFNNEGIQNVSGKSACYHYRAKDLQEINSSELCFPSGHRIKSACLPQRQTHIPAVFQSPPHYKQTFTSCIIEHLNILLFALAQKLHKALLKVDISFYTSSKGEKLKNVDNNLPSCHHNQPAKLVMAKKEGPNKGRLFYACDRPKADQCKFFKWVEEVTSGCLTQEESWPSMILSDIKSIGLYLRSQKIPIYEECQLLVRKGFEFQRKQYGKLKKFTTINPECYSEPKSKLYLKLSRKECSSVYSKDDLWVISKTLDFGLDTFIACSAFFGPSSVNEVELLPLKGYFPSKWPMNTVVHALLVCNASTELTTLKNIQDYFNPATLPLMPYLLAMCPSTEVCNKRVNTRKFTPPALANISTKFELPSLGATLQLASELIETYKLNMDQATALIQIAQMMASQENVEEVKEQHIHTLPITIIHGVFGAGKSYLLAVVILFFVQLFEKSEALTFGNTRPWKLLISSSTNVAVDRVLLGLLSLGFEKFVRVGSVRKIAKPILPYSLHAGSENENEQLKELHALLKENLTPVEKIYVRRSIEQHKLGTNRTLLKEVRVVGVTCAACPFPCMNDLKFPVVVLDECSQMTEPASLLPIARFECEKLILVGDPKQLPPTIQGSDAAHENGLEQTLFDRLCLMGHKPILLRTQYRCHPAISAIANDLFYEGNLMNGISEIERSPLLEWLPTLCFYNVKGLEQIERDNSFHNVAEAAFTLKLIQSLIASGIAGSMIGVITLYKSQMYKLCHLLSAVDFDHANMKMVQVSTVDAFQGAEKEIIILSCVRTRHVGFIDSEKRMNVALTRGRRHLLIVGNLACLRNNRLWGHVIQHCEGREGGLQHASQYEPQLNHLLKDYFEKQAEEKQKKK
ncbi:5'-3' DNA helicase ZGRF1 [Ctenodactylus gundi]